MDVIVSQSDGNDLQKNKKNKNKSFSCGSLFAISVKADNTTITTITIPKRNVNLTLTTACTNKPLPVRLYVASSSGGSFLCLGSLQNQKPMVQMGVQFTDSIQLKAEPIKSYSSESHLFVNIFGTIQPISSPPTPPSTTKITTTSNKNDGDVNDGTTKKRKLNQVDKNDDVNDNLEKKSVTDNNNKNNKNNDNNNNELPLKLTKKERKRLAKQKAMELQQVLLQNQEKKEGTNNDTQKTKNNKKNKKETIVSSITQQRRLEGGLLVRDIIIGSGSVAKSGKKVSIHYEGKLTDTDKVFDRNQSRTNPLSFRVGTGQVIKGLERGMEGMRVGGERVLTIPATLGYGAKGSGNVIPKNASLTFTVKLISIGGR